MTRNSEKHPRLRWLRYGILVVWAGVFISSCQVDNNASDLGGSNVTLTTVAIPATSSGPWQVPFPGLQPFGQMGASVAFVDWDGDGLLDLAAGAPETGNPGAGFAAYQAGQVSIYLGLPGGGFSSDPGFRFNSPGSIIRGRFGRAMAVCDILDDGTRNDLLVGASGERKVYVYLNIMGTQDATPDRVISAPGGQGDTDEFGESVACGRFNGVGGEDIVVGAPGGDTGGTNTGRLFFYNNDSTPGLIDISGPNSAYFISPSSDFGAGTQPYCGRGLAMADYDGDGISDLVVGCPFADAGGTNDGLIGFYKKAAANDGNDWATAGSELPPNNDDRWGEALAPGNFDDSLAGLELAVGQPGLDSPGSNAGGIHLYGVTFPGPNFALSSILRTISDRGANGVASAFGRSLSGGDISGDGVDDLAVGAPEEDLTYSGLSLATNIGTFYQFDGTPGALLDGFPEKADFNTLVDSKGSDVQGGTYNMRFGYSLCTGDINNNGKPDLLIGAENDPTDGPGKGRLYVWFSIGTGEIDLYSPPDAVFASPGMVVNKRFGSSCLVMDFDGDGRNDLLVGTQYADDNAADQGAVYIYLGQPSTNSGGSDTGSVPLNANPDISLFVPLNTGAASHYFGKSLASCDLTGDGFPELMVGARAFDGATTNIGNPRGSTNEGAVFIFQGSASGVNPVNYQGIFPTDQNVGQNLYGQPGYSDNNFGYAISCFPTVNGSSDFDLVIGAPYAAKTGGNANQGMVAMFLGAVNQDPSAYCATNDFVGSACMIEDTRDVRIDDQSPIANDDSWFGSALAIGDWDGLAGSDLLIGSGRARLGGTAPNNNGGVYAFRGNTNGGFQDFVSGVPLAAFSYLDPTGYVDNRFGDGAMALTDLNNNGVPELLMGSWLCSYDNPTTGRKGASAGCLFTDYGDYRP